MAPMVQASEFPKAPLDRERAEGLFANYCRPNFRESKMERNLASCQV